MFQSKLFNVLGSNYNHDTYRYEIRPDMYSIQAKNIGDYMVLWEDYRIYRSQYGEDQHEIAIEMSQKQQEKELLDVIRVICDTNWVVVEKHG